MTTAFSKVRVWLGLLVLIIIAVWLCYDRTNNRGELDKLIADLRSEGPWHYRLAVQTHTVRFLPKGPNLPLALELRRHKAVLELTRLGTNAWPAVPSLLRLVTHKNKAVAYSAAGALAGIKAERHPDWENLSEVLSGHTGAAEIFRRVIASDSHQSSEIAYQRFGLIGLAATRSAAVTAYADLIEMLKFDTDPELRAHAITVLAVIETERKTIVPLVSNIARNKEEWPQVSAAAMEALAKLAPAESQTSELLHEGLKDQRGLVRLAAARALWKLGVPPNEIVPTLTSLSDHKLATVRSGALKLLSEMGRDGNSRNQANAKF